MEKLERLDMVINNFPSKLDIYLSKSDVDRLAPNKAAVSVHLDKMRATTKMLEDTLRSNRY